MVRKPVGREFATDDSNSLENIDIRRLAGRYLPLPHQRNFVLARNGDRCSSARVKVVARGAVRSLASSCQAAREPAAGVAGRLRLFTAAIASSVRDDAGRLAAAFRLIVPVRLRQLPSNHDDPAFFGNDASRCQAEHHSQPSAP